MTGATRCNIAGRIKVFFKYNNSKKKYLIMKLIKISLDLFFI